VFSLSEYYQLNAGFQRLTLKTGRVSGHSQKYPCWVIFVRVCDGKKWDESGLMHRLP